MKKSSGENSRSFTKLKLLFYWIFNKKKYHKVPVSLRGRRGSFYQILSWFLSKYHSKYYFWPTKRWPRTNQQWGHSNSMSKMLRNSEDVMQQKWTNLLDNFANMGYRAGCEETVTMWSIRSWQCPPTGRYLPPSPSLPTAVLLLPFLVSYDISHGQRGEDKIQQKIWAQISPMEPLWAEQSSYHL